MSEWRITTNKTSSFVFHKHKRFFFKVESILKKEEGECIVKHNIRCFLCKTLVPDEIMIQLELLDKSLLFQGMGVTDIQDKFNNYVAFYQTGDWTKLYMVSDIKADEDDVVKLLTEHGFIVSSVVPAPSS